MTLFVESRWKDVRESVHKLNPKLSHIIDELNPSDKFTFYRIKYNFGDEILQNAGLYLPTKSGLISIKDSRVDTHIQDNLGYNFGSNPVGMLLEHSVELFIASADRIIPYAIIQPGHVFGTWRILDTKVSYCPPTFIWGMTAGARSLFMLAKISENASHLHLSKKLHIKIEKPKSLVDHGKVFREIANSNDFKEPWQVEFLFFSKKWFEQLHDKGWEKFKLYLLDAAWQSSSYWRNEYVWNYVFSLIQQNRNIKPPTYIANIVKHLLAIGVGAMPGFRPAFDDTLGPIKRLQEIYINEYNLKDYAPIIMAPSNFSLKDTSPIYYSLQYPTTIEFALKSSERTSAMTDLYLVSSLLKKYLKEIQTGKLNIAETPLESFAQKAKFDFFHNNVTDYTDFKESALIPKEDNAFGLASTDENKNFPKNSSFLNGCIRISY
jgi:hypothetical protein